MPLPPRQVRAGRQLETRTLPAAVPTALDSWFNVLLVSCFHQAEDRKGLAGIIASQLKAVTRPHLTLLMGDQVYLDLPTLQDFPMTWPGWPGNSKTITRNWHGPLGYPHILSAAPCLCQMIMNTGTTIHIRARLLAIVCRGGGTPPLATGGASYVRWLSTGLSPHPGRASAR